MQRMLADANENMEEMVAIRRHLHMHPELSFEEKATAAFIVDRLRSYGLDFETGVAGHGIVARIEGEASGPCVALRADMDALPIMETSSHDYVSRNDGVMHACGHDVHTAMLLGAARMLHTQRESLRGSVKLIFQPAEERLPGGASLMIKEGVLKNPKVDAILGQHVTPELDVGKIAIRPGPFMASADEIHLVVKGKGGHAAMPQNLIDPVLITSHLIVGLQQVVSRRNTPWIPSVLSFGKVHANGATNVIPSEVVVEGTFRTFDESWRQEVHTLLPKMIHDLVSSMGGTVDVDIKVGYPVLNNDKTFTDRCEEVAKDLLGPENVLRSEIRMGAEDFAFYSHESPACFYRLGSGSNVAGSKSGLHTSDFNVDEDCMRIGSALMASIALSELNDR